MNRLIVILAVVGAFVCFNASGAEDKLWSDNKLTPAQPFPGKVCAVATLWPGYDLLIEENGGPRVCLVRVWIPHPLEYSVLDPTKGETKENPKCLEANGNWTYLSPAIDVDRFSWSIGPMGIGRFFGDQDVLRKVIAFSAQSK
ncbi:MAG: hypothetical protein ABJF10_17180 [Chthoniobacter sp.]|uniref:hypothetical protein n=1 Tax=Chthoniobacter sp. TaxID=2510640 RepID=UPI0032A38911